MLSSQNYGGDALNVGSPSSSLQAPSPFPDLGMAELSPLTSGVNLNIGQMYDNKMFMGQGGNLNGNSVYSPGTQSVNDNLPSPLILPLDNLDPNSPSSFMAFNPNQQLASPDPLTTNTNNGNYNINSPVNINTTTTTTTTGATPTAATPVEELDNKNNLNLNVTSNTTSNIQYSPGASEIKTELTFIKQEPVEAATEQQQVDPNANIVDINRIMAEVHETPSQTRRLLIDQVTDAIIEAHMCTTINTYANVRDANDRIKSSQAGPGMPDLSKMSLSATSLWQQFLTSMVPEITKVVKFCKKLPGFSEVVQEDQIKLIKQGTFEVMLCRFSILVDHVNEEMFDPWLTMKSPRHIIQQTPMGPFLDEFFLVAQEFNPLGLTDGEIGLFTSILMICPDRAGLQNTAPIRAIQQLYLQALYYLMKHTHEDPDNTFFTVVSMIPMFRKINEDHSKFLNNIKMKSPEEYSRQFPALHQEIFDS